LGARERLAEADASVKKSGSGSQEWAEQELEESSRKGRNILDQDRLTMATSMRMRRK
jgi:hypothetical protein